MPRVSVALVGDADSLVRSFNRSTQAGRLFSREMTSVAVSAKASARVQIEAAVKKDARLRQEIGAYRAVASAAARGSREQIVAANLAAHAEQRLSRSLGVTAAEARLQSRAFQQSERSLARFGRGAIAGSGVFRGLGRAIAFASSGFLGGVGLTFAIRRTIGAAKEQQIVNVQLQRSLEALGLSYAANRGQIEQTIQAQSRMSAFDDEQLSGSFTRLVRRTGDVTEALKLNALTASIARARNIDLVAASTLLIRALAGNARAATTLGLPMADLGKNASKAAVAQSILASAQRRYAGQAAVFGRTAAGAQGRFNKALQDSEEIIGRAVLPALADLADHFGRYLNRINRTGELQTKVNNVIGTAKRVFEGMRDGVRDVRVVLDPLVTLLGGARRAVEALLIAMAVRKAIVFAGVLTDTLIPAMRTLKTASYEAAGGLTAVDLAAAGAGGGTAGKGVGRFAKILSTLGASLAIGGVVGTLTGGLRALATSAGRAATIASRLLGRLALLGRIGTITIAIELLVNAKFRKQVRGAGEDLASGFGLFKHLPSLNLAKHIPSFPGSNLLLGIPNRSNDAFPAGAEEGHRPLGADEPQQGVHGALLEHERRRERARSAALKAVLAARAAAAAARKRAEAVLNRRISLFEIASTRAQLTESLADDNRVLREEEAFLRRELRNHALSAQRRLELQQEIANIDVQLAQNQAQIRQDARDRAQRAREKALARRNAAQFRALGLGPTGEELAPTRRALRAELANVSQVVKGTILDTGHTRNLLRSIRRLLSGELGALSAEVSSKVKELLDNLKGQLNEFDGFNLTAADRRRRFLDRRRADRYNGRPDHPTRGGNTYNYSPTINQVKEEKLEKTLRKDFFRQRVVLGT